MKIDNFNAYLKLLVRGEPIRPFNITLYPPQEGEHGIAEKLKELSYLKFGQDREEVEKEIKKKYIK